MSQAQITAAIPSTLNESMADAFPPLRISYFASTCHEAGTYFRFHNWAMALVELGQDVTVWTSDQDPASSAREEMRDGVKYRIVPSSRMTGTFMATCHPLTAFRRCFLKYEPCDIAHLFQPFPIAAIPWWLRMGSKAQCRLYDWDDLWTGGLLAGVKYNYFRNKWLRFCLKRCESRLPSVPQGVTTCSRFLAELATERGAKGTQVIYNGLWPYEPAPRNEARQRLNLRQDALYVGFMGRTVAELDWCFDAVLACQDSHPRLRFALCGPAPEFLANLSPTLRERVDYLGQLTAYQTRDFAAALDIGLLPLENNAFNQSRFPIKFAEYLAAGVPVLASEVGECDSLSKGWPWVLRAGTTRESWMAAFASTIDRASRSPLPTVDRVAILDLLSWKSIGTRVLSYYREQMNLAKQFQRRGAQG